MKPLLSLLAMLGLAACTMGPDYHLPVEAQINQPKAQAAFVSATPGATTLTPVPAGWWRLYDDPQLNQLEQEALAANNDLRVAAANLARAQATQQEVEGAGDVKIGGNFAAERAQLSGQSYLLPVQMPTQYLGDGGVHVAYQLDLFGRLKRAAEAASDDREATAAGLDVARITVAADVARAYVEACSAGHEMQAATHILALQRHARDASAQLVAAGRQPGTLMPGMQALVEQAQAAVPPYQARQKLALYRLAILTGHPPADYPRAVEACDRPPQLQRPLPVGDGAALLKRRPDIRQAERGLAAATARIGVATAALYPDVSLGLSVGSTGLLTQLTEASAGYWGLGSLISWTLPDASSHARVEGANAAAAASLAHFDAVVLNALRETESSLTVYARDLQRNADLHAARDHLAEAADQAEGLFKVGRSPFLSGLSAKQALAQADQAVAVSEDQISADQVSLFLALGGGW